MSDSEEYRNACYVQQKRHMNELAFFLCHDVMRGDRHLYTIPLLKVYGSEENLNGGRFEHFVRTEQEWNVPLSIKGGQEKLHHDFREWVEWIAEQTDLPWTFLVEAHSIGHLTFTFSFSDVTAAVLFKLVWY